MSVTPQAQRACRGRRATTFSVIPQPRSGCRDLLYLATKPATIAWTVGPDRASPCGMTLTAPLA
jgi:hypothetical protein